MNKKTGESIRNTEPILVTALLLVFALIALALVSSGAKNYGAISKTMEDNYDIRTSLSYVSTKIRQADTLGAITVEETSFGVPSLVLQEQDGDDIYKTWIYYFDGALREFFGDASLEFNGEDGNTIVKLNSFTIAENESNLIEISVENGNGVSRAISIGVRSK